MIGKLISWRTARKAASAKWNHKGITWVEPELTTEQYSLAAQLVFEAAKTDDIQGSLVADLTAALVKENRFARLLAIILVPEGEDFHADRLEKNAEIMKSFPAEWGWEALVGFFSRNRKSTGALPVMMAMGKRKV